MGTDVQLTTLVSAAAVALVTEMVKGSWASARDLAARLFRHAGPAEETRQLTRLDSDRAQIATLDRTEVEQRWRRRLLTLAEDYPEVVTDLALLAGQSADGRQPGIHQTATGNTGTVVQVGRDNFGNLNSEGRRP